MDTVEDKLVQILNAWGCATLGELSDEVPCSAETARRVLVEGKDKFWQSVSGYWYHVGFNSKGE